MLPEEIEPKEAELAADAVQDLALDEDLFDFPDATSASSVARSADSGTGDPADSVASEGGEDLAPGSPEASVPEVRAAQTARGYDLDEDLFDFPKLEDIENAPTSPDVEESVFDGAHDLIDTDLGDDLKAIFRNEPESPSPATDSDPVDRDPGPALDDPEPLRERAGTNLKPRARRPQAPAGKRLSSRTLLPIIAASIVLNLVLVALAWNARAAFRDNVESFRSDMLETFSQLTLAREPDRPEVVEARSPVEVEVVEPAQVDSEQTAQTQPTPTSTEEIQLRVARDSIENGEFGLSRKQLYRLLAQTDRSVNPDISELEAEAQFLIADSYRLQALALREAGE